MLATVTIQRSQYNVRQGLVGGVADSDIRYDERGAARWTSGGQSLLWPSNEDPGPRPVSTADDWFTWDDRDYAWQIAYERFHLSPDYVPPAVSAAALAGPVTTDTVAEVIKGAGPGATLPNGGSVPVTAVTPSSIPATNSSASPQLNANRTAAADLPENARYLTGGVLIDGNNKVIKDYNAPSETAGVSDGGAQSLPANATVASAPFRMPTWAWIALGLLLLGIVIKTTRGKKG